ncbi:MAG: hypothetical protein ACR2QU_07040 [Gammaproteobacteria bacterium]
MFVIDMDSLQPVGEFGSREWCEACAAYGVEILQASDLPSDLSWGFSEIYTCPPDRLVGDDWPQSGYHFMVNKGVISGGASVPDECLAIPGFHVNMRWAYICNQSGSKYGSAGQKQRSAEEGELAAELEEYLGYPPDLGGVPNPVWPQPIIAALSVGVEEGAGLHNIAASLQRPSPEFAEMPTTELGVPVFSRMTEPQKADFVALCGIESAQKMVEA